MKPEAWTWRWMPWDTSWTTTIHTATMIPMSATRVGAHRFSGWKDNILLSYAIVKTHAEYLPIYRNILHEGVRI